MTESHSPYVCPVCESEFDSSYQRGGHLGSHHTTEEKRESLLKRLEQLSDEKGETPIRRDVDDCNWGSASTFESVFESWNAAVEAIGHDPVRKTLSEEALTKELKRLADELDRTPRKKDMADQGQYGTSVYRRRFGSWNQALIKAGLEPTTRHKIPTEELLSELHRVAKRLLRAPTKAEFDEHGRFCSATYVNQFGSWNDALRAANCPPSRNFDISRAQLTAELQTMGEKLGKPPAVSEARELSEYGISTYEREFGTWNEALQAAGFGVNQRQTVSKEDLLASLKELAAKLGSSPTVVEYREMGTHSFNTYWKAFGGWNDALEAAGLDTNAAYGLSRTELLKELTRLDDILGHPPTSVEMDAFGRYSVQPYYSQFSSWSDALAEAGFTPWETRRHHPHPIYGVGWDDRVRELVRERDGRECARCGMPERSHLDEFDRRLDVHHICGARTSTNPAVFNAPRNLITLCLTCHFDAEQYTPGLPPDVLQPGPLPDGTD